MSLPFTLTHGTPAVLTNTRALDAETDPPVYHLLVQAFDGLGLSAVSPLAVTVTLVNVDDNQPRFSQLTYSGTVSENYVGEVLTVQASDADGDAIVFELEDRNLFSIDQRGAISLSTPLDYEANTTEYSLAVRITGCNGSERCYSTVQVSVQDENEHSPEFSADYHMISIPLDVFPMMGVVIGRVAANDADSGPVFGEIAKYSIISDPGPFSIHPLTGDISVSNPALLRERSQTVAMEISAVDGGGLSSSVTVEIFIPVFNLHAPIFEQRYYQISWEENYFNFRLPGLPTNALLQVRVQDLDQTSNSVNYHLVTESEQFLVSPDGFVVLKEELDFEQKSEYYLQIRAFDGLYNSTFDAELRVAVMNQNDNPPSFTQSRYLVNISEHYRTFSLPVLTLQASDIDSSLVQLSYSILDHSVPFRVDYQGHLFVLTQLDYEVTKKYEFKVEVSDGSYRSDQPADVTVTLSDENDHYPYFAQPVYQVSLDENTLPGDFSFPITAEDLDSSEQFGSIAGYAMLENHVPFEIQSNELGEVYITNTETLDYESNNHVYVFHVHAYDSGGLRSLFPTQVIAVLADTDDCPPSFAQKVYTARINENARVPTYVVKVTASDCDLDPQFNQVEFSIENHQNTFTIHPVSGVVMALKLFDLESGDPNYQLVVRASSATNPSLTDTAVVNVTIQDVNEFHPQFIDGPYSVNIPENTQIGTIVLSVEAIDRDSGPLFGAIESYTFVGRVTGLPFEINATTGGIILTEGVDFESGVTRYRVLVSAADGGRLVLQTSLEVRVTNVEDEPPYFEEVRYNIEVPENSFDFLDPNLPLNGLIQLRVNDRDTPLNELTFILTNTTLLSTFGIDSQGYLYLKHPLDHETQPTYSLVINITDGVFSSPQPATVVVNVINTNDNPPLFYSCLDSCCGGPLLTQPINIELSENVIPESPLLSLSACDVDNGVLDYIVTGGDGVFQFDGSQLALVGPLDYETKAIWYVNITASDGVHNSINNVVVTIQVLNIDEFPLEFENEIYSIALTENTAPGMLDLSIKAIDRDLEDASEITYSIEDNDVPFTLTMFNGLPILTSTKMFDFEEGTEWYSFNITARASHSEPATASVQVTIKDTNEFTPAFKSQVYKGSLMENTPNALVAMVTAVDGDSGELYGHVTYSVSESQWPCVVNDNGEITNTESIDADRGLLEFEVVVMATDGGGLTASTQVLVSVQDSNDNSPYFTPVHYYTVVAENADVGEFVVLLECSDNDHTPEYSTVAEYSLESPQGNIPFSVNASGHVTVAGTLDYESDLKTFSFQGHCVDNGGLWSQLPARVVVDVTNVPDKPPLFSQTHYTGSVRENAPNGTIVTQLRVRSVDGGSFNCELNDRDLPFSIGGESTLITVSGQVDYETVNVYLFDVVCYSAPGTASSTAAVEIRVLNSNDHQPMFKEPLYQATLVENAPRGTLQLEIQAVDKDTGNAGLINRFLLYQTGYGFFVESFNQTSGKAIITNLIQFDYESRQSIELQARAIDRGNPPLTSDPVSLIVHIEDANDNVPKFTQDVYFSTLAENVAGPVLTTIAVDMDSGNVSGAVMAYEIQPPTPPFTVSSDGEISVSQALDYESFATLSQTRIQFSVVAFDGYGMSSRPALVLINVLNENDNYPRPLLPSEWPVKTAVLEWGSPVSAEPVFTLNAIDDDSGDQLFYSLNSVGGGFPFTLLNVKSGEVILQRPLSELRTYEFTVTVQDRHPFFFLADTKSIQWEVHVEVRDTNSPPYFSTSQLFQQLTLARSRVTFNQTLLQLVARDDDHPDSDFATISSYILTPIDSLSTSILPFDVTSNGEIMVTEPLRGNQYAFTVAAVDGGGLVSTSPVAVTIFVLDGNDALPVFQIEQLQFVLPVSTEVGSLVVELTVNDTDMGLAGEVECHLETLNPYFEIDLESCAVKLSKSLIDEGLEGSLIELVVTATDKGSPPLSSTATLRITVESGKIELMQNSSEVFFIEEGGPVKLAHSFEIAKDRLLGNFQYSLFIQLTPWSGFTPDTYSTQCLANGNIVNLLNCYPRSTGLLPEGTNTDPPTSLSATEVSPSLVQRASNTNFLYQTWIKSNHIGTRHLLAAYVTNNALRNDLMLLVQVTQNSVVIIVGPSQQVTFVVPFQTSLLLNDASWHHIAVLVRSQQDVQVFVDGSPQGDAVFNWNFNLFPDQLYMYTGRLKNDDNKVSIYTTLLWKTSFEFGFDESQLLASLTCMLSCGETLNIVTIDTDLIWSVTSNQITAQSSDIQSIARVLAELSYDNIASEPLVHQRQVGVVLADEDSRTNSTVTIHTLLRNDHVASIDLNFNTRRDLFYYIAPGQSPYTAPLVPGLLFEDQDTTQTNYRVRVDIRPLNRRSCDRMDYSAKIKLQQCLGLPSLPTVFDLSPNIQWGLHSLTNVRTIQLSLLGYYFYGQGVLIPDSVLYDSLELTPNKFSLVLWIIFTSPGTIVQVSNATMSFKTSLRANSTHLSVSYSHKNLGNVLHFSWPWTPGTVWSHVAMTVNEAAVTLCIDGIFCGSQSLPNDVNQPLPFTGVNVFVGASPSGDVFTDRFTGTLNGLALLSNYNLPLTILNCMIACSEKVVIEPSSLKEPLSALLDTASTGVYSINGSLQIGSNLTAPQLQNILKRSGYVNTHPYLYSGTRSIQFTVYDEGIVVKPPLQTRLSVHVLHHKQRTVSLLRVGRQSLTSSNVVSGVKVFENSGITSDTKSVNLDSLLVEMTSTPASAGSCYHPPAADCSPLLTLDRSLLAATSLQIVTTPTKLLVFGLGNVTLYESLLRQVVLQTKLPEGIVDLGSEVNIKVYVSDMNGVSSSTRTARIFVQESTAGRRKRRSIVPEGDGILSGIQTLSIFGSIFILLVISVFVGLFYLVRR